MRGFKSCVDNRLHFGLGASQDIDSLVVNWPDGKCTVLYDVAVNQFLILDQKDAINRCLNIPEKQTSSVFQKIEQIKGLDFTHRENDFVDFNRDRLLFHMLFCKFLKQNDVISLSHGGGRWFDPSIAHHKSQ